jgi:hypothetical protein
MNYLLSRRILRTRFVAESSELERGNVWAMTSSRSNLFRDVFLGCIVAFYFGVLPASAERIPDEASADEIPIDEIDRDHWAFEAFQSPPLPAEHVVGWSRNPLDRFIDARLRKENLRPQPSASRRVLIRRLSFNLLGIPPTPGAVQRFVEDTRPEAYERLVDRYLASPRYGEQFAQQWLDLARFAETDGFEHDKVRQKAWQYRDWIVSSLNANIPYDRFLSLQLAGDLLEPQSETSRIATAFGLSGPDMPDINSQDERRHNVLNEMTSTVSAVVLGLQAGCAQCHDHKFDPISQADFYRLRAIFEPSLSVERNKSLETLVESKATSVISRVWVKGDWRRPGAVVQPGFLRVLTPSLSAPSDLDGHPRVAFAQWLTGEAAPLVSRVMVNRIWQSHFGRGLSETPSDFGVIGDSPSHPDLLNWLADDFRRDWDMKRLHRMIVLSSVYRQTSASSGNERVDSWRESLQADPDAVLLSRFPRQRIRAEMVRDAMLVAADTMNWQQGGPGIRPPLPAELRITLLPKQWEVTADVTEHSRRSIYVFARRNLRYPVLESFDRPDANASCDKRAVSTTASQALFVLNSQFAWDLALRLANRVKQVTPTDEASQVTRMFQFTLSREPSQTELAESLEFLRNADRSPVAPLTELALVLFNCNEFYYID